MASSLPIMILIALISAIAIRNSTGRGLKSAHRKEESKDGSVQNRAEIERYLRNLCAASTSKKTEKCWKIIEPALPRFNDRKSTHVAGIVFDLAIERSQGIRDELGKLFKESGDDQLRKKYHSCFENYNNAYFDLVTVRGIINSLTYLNIPPLLKEAKNQLKACKQQFHKESFDPAHVRNRNNEFGVYMDTVKTASILYIGGIGGDSNKKAK